MQLSLFDNEDSFYEEILLSLQEKYFIKIINGQKKNEYRFSFLKTKSKAFIYLPKNKQQIVGVVFFGKPYWKDVESASKFYSDIGDGEYSIMYDWLKDKKGCYIIPIERYIKFERPISKEELKSIDDFIAPQTYLLLKNRINLKSFLNDYEIKEGEVIVK